MTQTYMFAEWCRQSQVCFKRVKHQRHVEDYLDRFPVHTELVGKQEKSFSFCQKLLD